VRSDSVRALSPAELEALRTHARERLTAEDYQRLEWLVASYEEQARLLRDKDALIARLRRKRSSSSSEKSADILPAPALGSADAESAPASEPASDPDPPNAPPSGAASDPASARRATRAPQRRRRRGHGRIPVDAYQPATHTAVPHTALCAHDPCPSCRQGTVYPLRPQPVLHLVGQAPLVAHRFDCERLRCGRCGEVFTAPAPPEARGPKYSASAAAVLAVLHYGTGLPWHRLEQLQRNVHTPVPASTQWEVVCGAEPSLRPVFEALMDQAAAASVLHTDDTSVRILELMGRRRAKLLEQEALERPERTGLFTTATVSIAESRTIVLFHSGRSHAGENLKELLDRRAPDAAAPLHMCDGLDRNRARGHAVIECNCLAHGRRHFVDERENHPDECRFLIESLGAIFHNEGLCAEDGLTPEARLEFHQKHSAPLLANLHAWLQSLFEEKRVEPNSGLGKAVKYMLSRWEALTRFTRIAGAPLDNNIAERALKYAIRHRKNSLFYRTTRGAEVGDLYMSLIHTAQLHGENPIEYLTALMEHGRSVALDPTAWLPWNFRSALDRLRAAASAATSASTAAA
jgi:hypothetical protein